MTVPTPLPTPPVPEPNTFVFNREPAAWSAAAYSVVAMLSAFVFEWSPEVQATIMTAVAAVLAVLQALKVRPVQVPIFGGALVAFLNLAVAFGLDLTPDQQGVAAAVGSSVLTLVFVRPAVSTTATLNGSGTNLPRAA